jgi:hypothetical protein
MIGGTVHYQDDEGMGDKRFSRNHSESESGRKFGFEWPETPP